MPGGVSQDYFNKHPLNACSTRRAKKIPNGYAEELSDIVMDDSEEAPEVEFSSQSQSSHAIGAPKAHRKELQRLLRRGKKPIQTKDQ